MDKNYKLSINSPILEALSPEHDDEITARTANASVAFGRLCTNVWERNGIRLDPKLKVYKAVVLPLSYMHVRPGQYTNATPRDLTIHA